jgi:hypothetical protein
LLEFRASPSKKCSFGRLIILSSKQLKNRRCKKITLAFLFLPESKKLNSHVKKCPSYSRRKETLPLLMAVRPRKDCANRFFKTIWYLPRYFPMIAILCSFNM